MISTCLNLIEENYMIKKIFLGLIISIFTFMLFTHNNFLIVNASSCTECTENELCEYHKLYIDDNQHIKGNEENDTNGKPIEIVDDDNDEGITLLGDNDINYETD